VFVITSLLLLFFYVFALFKINVTIGNYLFGTSKTITQGYSYDVVKYAVIRDMLTSLSVVIGFALVIKLVKRWWQKQKETEQLIYEKTKAELQLLKAQVHPHFLFNTLNNIYFFTITGSPQAPEMIKKLSGLLHYILNECNQPLVQVDKEIKMIQDYMALEKIRYGEQMNMSIDIQENSSNKMIAPLLLLPFVENSFKHGTSKMITNPWVQLRITIENDFLSFFIMNSRPLEPEFLMQKGNIGLKNVKQRLQMIYPAAHELRIVSEPESFAVYMKIQLKEVTSSSAPGEELKTTPVYAMA
jgi:LytS/YehU family sensor histidine kinase